MSVRIAGLVALLVVLGCGADQGTQRVDEPTTTASVETATERSGSGADGLGPSTLRTERPSEVEAVMDFQAGGDGSGCGYEPVTTFEGVYYRYVEPALVTGDEFVAPETEAIDGGEIGWPLIFCLFEGRTFTVTVEDPDGVVETFAEQSLEFSYEFQPGDPTGTWTFTADDGADQVYEDVIEVHEATARRIAPVDIDAAYTAADGDLVRYSVVGLPPSQLVDVAIYRRADDQVGPAAFVGLVDVETDQTGAAILTVEVSQPLSAGWYYLVPDPASPESQQASTVVMSEQRADLVIS